MPKKYYPFVSICTPTFNRRPFIENIIRCYKNQTYPKNRMEWVVIDDGTDKIQDIFAKEKIQNLKYFATEKKNLGAKRNFMHTKCKGSIIVYMDDDDYYPPDRVEHAVERLMGDPNALCAGSSELYVYFKTLDRMVQFGPYGPKHATAGTFAFKKELLSQTKYEDHAAIAEERAFLKEYSIPFVQLDPMKTILVFSHEHNTFDKRELLKNPESPVMKDSTKTVDDFIKNEFENPIKNFFMKDIDGLLEKYDLGHPKNKPEVLKQTAEIKQKRADLEKKLNEENNNKPIGIVINTPQGQKNLTKNEVVEMLKELHSKINMLSQQVQNNSPITTKNDKGEQIVMTSQQVIELITELQKQNSNFKTESQKLTQQLQDLQKQNKELQEKTQENQDLEQLTQQLQDLQKQNKELQEKTQENQDLEQLTQQLQDLQKQNKELQEQTQENQDLEQLTKQNQELQEQNQELQQQTKQYQDLQQQTKQIQELKDQIQLLQQQAINTNNNNNNKQNDILLKAKDDLLIAFKSEINAKDEIIQLLKDKYKIKEQDILELKNKPTTTIVTPIVKVEVDPDM